MPLGQRIDRRGLLGAGHLGQAQLGPVGALAHEFGVDRHELGVGQGLAEGGQVIGRGDELHSHRRIAGKAASAKLPQTWKGPILLT